MNEETRVQAAAPPSPKHNREMFWLVAVAVLVIVGLLAMGILPRLSQKAALAQSTKQAKNSVPSVVVTKPKLVSDGGISLPGNVQAIKETTINGRMTGYVQQLYVDIGSKVKAGQLLALIVAPDTDQQYDQAVAQTNQQRAVVTQAQATVAQQRAIVAQDQADVTKQRETVEQAKAQLASAVAAVAQAQAAEQGAESGLVHYQQALGVQKANLQQQQASENLAQTTYNRYKDLVAQGFDSQQDLDQALATLKTSQATVVSAQAAVQGAEADVTTAEKTLDSAKAAVTAAQANVTANEKNVKLNYAGLVSAVATVKSAMAGVNANQATVAANVAGVASNVANEKRYNIMKGFEKVVAPFDGIITSRSIDVGTLIVGDSATGATAPTSSAIVSNSGLSVSGAGMLGLARIDEVRIQVSVPQAFVPALVAGSTAQVVIREIPNRTFTGTVTLRAGAMDTTSRTQLVEVHLKNPTGLLVPGMYATVNVTPFHPAMTLHVPGTALIVDSNGTRVGIVTSKKTVHLQPVVIGRDFGTEVEILSGLTGNEKLVNNPSDLLQEGDKVQIATAVGGRRRGGAGGGAAGAPGGGGAEGGSTGRGDATGGSADRGGAGGGTPGGAPGGSMSGSGAAAGSGEAAAPPGGPGAPRDGGARGGAGGGSGQ